MGKRIDLTGQRFGKLIVIEYAGTREMNSGVKAYWKCKCDCGKEKVVSTCNLRSGATKTCGDPSHYRGRKCPKSHTENYGTHRLSNHRLYNIWCAMKQRCYDKNFGKYHSHGARGIKVCDEWRGDFMAFYNWAINNGYQDDLSIDRIDNDGDYSPENCRWADAKTQSNNTRTNVFVEYSGEKHTIAEWSRIKNLPYGALRRRIVDAGWPIEDALTIPVQTSNNQNARKKVEHA